MKCVNLLRRVLSTAELSIDKCDRSKSRSCLFSSRNYRVLAEHAMQDAARWVQHHMQQALYGQYIASSDRQTVTHHTPSHPIKPTSTAEQWQQVVVSIPPWCWERPPHPESASKASTEQRQHTEQHNITQAQLTLQQTPVPTGQMTLQ